MRARGVVGQGKSFNHKRAQRDTKFDVRVLYLCQFTIQLLMKTTGSHERSAILKPCLPSCPLWLILQLEEDLRHGFQR
jgi:hypothetical protein